MGIWLLEHTHLIDPVDALGALRLERKVLGHHATCVGTLAEWAERTRWGFLRNDPRRPGAMLGRALVEWGTTLTLGTGAVVLLTLVGAQFLGLLIVDLTLWTWATTLGGALFLTLGVALTLRPFLRERARARRHVEAAAHLLGALAGHVDPDARVELSIGYHRRAQPVGAGLGSHDDAAALGFDRVYAVHLTVGLADERTLWVGYGPRRSEGAPWDVLITRRDGRALVPLGHQRVDAADDAFAELAALAVDQVTATEPRARPPQPPTPRWSPARCRLACLLSQLLQLPLVVALGALAAVCWWHHVQGEPIALLVQLRHHAWIRWLQNHGADLVLAYVVPVAFAQAAYLLEARYELTARLRPQPA